MKFNICSYLVLIFYEKSSRLVDVCLKRIVKRTALKLTFAGTVKKCRVVSKEATKLVFSFYFIIFPTSWNILKLVFLWKVNNLKHLNVNRVLVTS